MAYENLEKLLSLYMQSGMYAKDGGLLDHSHDQNGLPGLSGTDPSALPSTLLAGRVLTDLKNIAGQNNPDWKLLGELYRYQYLLYDDFVGATTTAFTIPSGAYTWVNFSTGTTGGIGAIPRTHSFNASGVPTAVLTTQGTSRIPMTGAPGYAYVEATSSGYAMGAIGYMFDTSQFGHVISAGNDFIIIMRVYFAVGTSATTQVRLGLFGGQGRLNEQTPSAPSADGGLHSVICFEKLVADSNFFARCSDSVATPNNGTHREDTTISYASLLDSNWHTFIISKVGAIVNFYIDSQPVTQNASNLPHDYATLGIGFGMGCNASLTRHTMFIDYAVVLAKGLNR
jgi:hypothetical protein